MEDLARTIQSACDSGIAEPALLLRSFDFLNVCFNCSDSVCLGVYVGYMEMLH